MRLCLDYFLDWARRIGMKNVRVDDAGNFRAVLTGRSEKRLLIGSHLDTVPNAGAFDGVLGVVMGMALAESFQDPLPACTLEVVGFSEEEGVRFGRPFIGSIAFADGLQEEFLTLKDSAGISLRQAIESFGLSSERVRHPQMEHADGYLEFHIEQGPVLESLGLPLGVVDAIAGQTRALVEFVGKANHAGTTPMNLRHDAFCAAAEWTLAVERSALQCTGLVATVGSVRVAPGATNVVPGNCAATLDIRHAQDWERSRVFENLLLEARSIGEKRGVSVQEKVLLQQSAVAMNPEMIDLPFHRMTSGAGHDAMIVAKRVPAAMIFLRSPGGISHHPDETVLREDVEAAFAAGLRVVENFI